jgi:tetratricopeptide (TPR) repeat protein
LGTLQNNLLKTAALKTFSHIAFFCVTLSILLYSCKSHDKLIAEINSEVDSLHNQASVTGHARVPDGLKNNINDFVKSYPADTLAPRYLARLGLLYENHSQYKEAIDMFERLQKEYPNAKQNSTALFLEGAIYNNEIKDYVKAKEKYELYLQKYPNVNPRITEDVKIELANMGKSPEELFKEMQKDSTSNR